VHPRELHDPLLHGVCRLGDRATALERFRIRGVPQIPHQPLAAVEGVVVEGRYSRDVELCLRFPDCLSLGVTRGNSARSSLRQSDQCLD
jgi:hypothetical protein